MSTHLSRGILLYQQDRYALAEQELRLAVAEEPEDPTAHAFLALCLAEQGKLDPAEGEAGLAIRYGPDDPFAHLVLAHVLFKRGRPAEAERVARESLRLDPTDAGTYAVLAAIRHDRRDWRGALEAAEDGLAHDPSHPGCTAARTLALLQLGRADDAGDAAADALRRNPDDPLAHTAQGWAELHAGRPRQALTHFREALRLDPSSEWARDGMIEALKARYWLYRQILRFFLWMGRLGRTAQWGLILGLLVVQQVLAQVGRANPALRPLTTPLLLALLAFVILTWVAEPLFNLLLRLNRFGRFALGRDQRRQSHWVGAVLLAGLLALAYGVAAPHGYDVPGWTTAFGCLLLLMPVSAVFRVPAGWPRWAMALYSLGMAGMIVGTVGCFYDALTAATPQGAEEMADQGFALFRYTTWAGLLSGFLANGLMTVRRRR
jgi:tetratricopeptide (TPR) repeat protein